MSNSIAIGGSGYAGHFGWEPGRRKVLIGALLGLAMAIAATAVALVELPASATHSLPDPVAAIESAPPVFASRELPRDWRWERPPIEFEHMYRRDDTPKLDWIREGRR